MKPIALRLVAILYILNAPTSWSQAPDCLRPFTKEIKDALGAPNARKLWIAAGGYGAEGQTGIQASLLLIHADGDAPERIFQILQNLRFENTVPNPFGSGNDQGLFAAISRLVTVENQQYVAADGVAKTIRAAGFENALGSAQAAVYDIYIANLLGGRPQIVGMQQTIRINNVERLVDLIQGAPGTPILNPGTGLLQVRLFENKSYAEPFNAAHFGQGVKVADGRFTYPAEFADGNSRLTTIAREFDREIVMHVSTNFDNWGWNFRPILLGQRAQIEDVFLQQFTSQLVTDALTPGQIATARAAFVQRLPQNLQFR